MWPKLSDRTTTAIWLLCITLVLTTTGALSRIDNVIYDTAQQNTDRPIPSDIVLITIDEQSLSSMGRWPWSRRIHAQLIDQLHHAGAKVIGFDVMFSEPQIDDLEADQLLADAMARAGNVVLPVVIEAVRSNGQMIETLPLPQLIAQAAALGRVHVELDVDNIARSITLWEGLDQPVWPHFTQSMLAVAGQLPASLPISTPHVAGLGASILTKHDQRYINFTSAQHHLPSMSYVQVIRGEFSPDSFRGKLVLVGSTAAGMADNLPTPVSGNRQLMPGVEFLANALISIRSETLIVGAPFWLVTLLSCALALTPLLWLPFASTRHGLLANIGLALLFLTVAMALPVWWFVWVPLSAGLVGLLCAYPIWSWRKLESASQFMDAELIRLQKALGTNPTSADADVASSVHVAADPFQRRIDQVRAATSQLQHFEQSQLETLAFISHDIRVPLASAASLIKHDLGAEYPAHQQLVRALAWTEEFLQTSRAQMLQPDSFAELDIVDLIHQLADDIYPLVKANSLTLALDLPGEPIWMQGHFDTLWRAIANLLSNAIKFSPTGGVIGLTASIAGGQICIDVTDQGRGIAPQDMSRLFKRFSRLEPSGVQSTDGVGLGLYFVNLSVKKHGGLVALKRILNTTIFTIYLPLTKQN